jgi:hypothetical protein
LTLQLVEHRYIRVNYESRVTWRQETDLLRCSPSFHGMPRRDFVMVDSGADIQPTFGQLVFVFTYRFRDTSYALALYQPFNAPISGSRPVDQDLGFCRIQEQPRRNSQIIPVRAIKRGALLIKDPQRSLEHLVVDTLDGDMFLRCIDLFPERGMAACRRA